MNKRYFPPYFKFPFFAFCFVFATGSFAQNVGINAGGSTPNSSAILDLNTGNTFTNPNGKGLLIPNVALTATNAQNPVTSPSTSLLVYNTATASSGSTAVYPGYYYWDGSKWVALTGPNSNDWALTGNAGTTVGTNFLGTTDNVDLQFNANNNRSGLIDIANFQTYFGYQAGLNTTSAGTWNSFFGYNAGKANTSGTGNTALGFDALLSNTTGTDNTAIGLQALNYCTGSANVALGTNAGFSISSGTNNTALGYYAINNGSNTTTGSNNTALGIFSSQLLTTGSFNTSSGYASLKNNTTGTANTAIGGDAQYYFNSNYNTAVGMWSLEGTSTPASNTGVGNTALGFCAGSGWNSGAATPNNYQVTTGSYNTFLGYGSAMSANSYTNTTGVGAFTLPGANDALVLGSISGTNGATNSAKVGIGTATPGAALDVTVPSGSSINAINADVSAGNTASNAIYANATGSPNYSAIYTVVSPTVAGTGFSTALSNHTLYANMNNSMAYSFAVYGRIAGAGTPSGGVMGYWGANIWGTLGYKTLAATTYGGYFNGSGGTGNTTTGTGRLANQDHQALVIQSIGMGAVGNLMGGWAKGDIYGMAVKGERVSLYVDGKTVVNQPIIQLTRTSDDKTMVNYTPASATPDLQVHGVVRMEKGLASVVIDQETLNQFASLEEVTVITTPAGQTNGIYAELRDGKLIIKENSGGTSNVKVNWMLVGKRNIDANFVPDEVKDKSFDDNMKDLMHNENDNTVTPPGIWWDGKKLNKGIIPN